MPTTDRFADSVRHHFSNPPQDWTVRMLDTRRWAIVNTAEDIVSTHRTRADAAGALLASMSHVARGAQLVEQARVVAAELVRVAILWAEQWFEGLEDASRQYYGAHDVGAMLRVLQAAPCLAAPHLRAQEAPQPLEIIDADSGTPVIVG